MNFMFSLLLILALSAMTSLQASKLSASEEFLQKRLGSLSNLNESIMKNYGSIALLEAKILRIDESSLQLIGNTSYFKLKNKNDVCRQVFIYGVKVVVHTVCYRDDYELLNFIKTYRKSS